MHASVFFVIGIVTSLTMIPFATVYTFDETVKQKFIAEAAAKWASYQSKLELLSGKVVHSEVDMTNGKRLPQGSIIEFVQGSSCYLLNGDETNSNGVHTKSAKGMNMDYSFSVVYSEKNSWIIDNLKLFPDTATAFAYRSTSLKDSVGQWVFQGIRLYDFWLADLGIDNAKAISSVDSVTFSDKSAWQIRFDLTVLGKNNPSVWIQSGTVIIDRTDYSINHYSVRYKSSNGVGVMDADYEYYNDDGGIKKIKSVTINRNSESRTDGKPLVRRLVKNEFSYSTFSDPCKYARLSHFDLSEPALPNNNKYWYTLIVLFCLGIVLLSVYYFRAKDRAK